MRISDWSSDVCSSDLDGIAHRHDVVAAGGDLVVEIGHVLERVGVELAGVQRLVGQHVVAEGDDLELEPVTRRDLFHHLQNFLLGAGHDANPELRSEEHTSELQSLMRISYAVFCLKKKTQIHT